MGSPIRGATASKGVDGAKEGFTVVWVRGGGKGRGDTATSGSLKESGINRQLER